MQESVNKSSGFHQHTQKRSASDELRKHLYCMNGYSMRMMSRSLDHVTKVWTSYMGDVHEHEMHEDRDV